MKKKHKIKKPLNSFGRKRRTVNRIRFSLEFLRYLFFGLYLCVLAAGLYGVKTYVEGRGDESYSEKYGASYEVSEEIISKQEADLAEMVAAAQTEKENYELAEI